MKHKISKQQLKRLEEANAGLDKLLEDIRPFSKKPRIEYFQSRGQWESGSNQTVKNHGMLVNCNFITQ